MRFVIIAALALTLPTAAAAQERFERNDKGEWVYERKGARSFLKEERKLDQYTSEYKDGRREVKREAKADGSWKEEIKTGRCEIKRERTSSGEYKEERKCG
jgi:hypothetical protein